MYQVNDTVLYGCDGVCLVSDITHRSKDDPDRLYYVLKPIKDPRATIYVPTDNEKALSHVRPTMSRHRIYEIIRSVSSLECIHIENEMQRKTLYAQILRSGDPLRIARLIKTLRLRRDELEQRGRRLHSVDEVYLKKAEELLFEEVSHVLSIQIDEVLPLIRSGVPDPLPE